MAALRHGISTVIIPKDNERDLAEIDQTVRNALKFVTAQSVETVLETALNKPSEVTPAILKNVPEDVVAKHRNTVIHQ